MTESIIQLEPFPRVFCIYGIIVPLIDSNKSSMSHLLIIIYTFKFEKYVLYIVLSSFSIFLNCENNVATLSIQRTNLLVYF